LKSLIGQGIRRTDHSISRTPSLFQTYKIVAEMPHLVRYVIFVTKASQHDLFCLHLEIPVRGRLRIFANQ
jgi:hypothetical protein